MSSLVFSLIRSRKRTVTGLVSSTSVDGMDIYSATLDAGMKTPMSSNILVSDNTDVYSVTLDAGMKTPMSSNILVGDNTDIYTASR